jgi:hypothetical protein
MSGHFRAVCAVGFLVLGLWGASRHVPLAASSAPEGRAVVVTELFTSEGCSSCPSADEVLSQLLHSQPIAGVEVLALGEHVDYWDRLGWRDPFSSALYSNRQSNYDARVFHRNEVYTPQLVIDGRFQRVGSDVDGIRRAIKQAADAPKADITVTLTDRSERELSARIGVDMPASLKVAETVDVLVAVTEDDLVSDVRRGENHGRTLRHSAVVRSLASIATLLPRESTRAMTTPISLALDWKPQNVRVIAFLQERDSRRIIGAGSARSAVVAETR